MFGDQSWKAARSQRDSGNKHLSGWRDGERSTAVLLSTRLRFPADDRTSTTDIDREHEAAQGLWTREKMKMLNPPHPGEVLHGPVPGTVGILVSDAAAALGVSRKTLSSILNVREGISPEMAVLLARRSTRARKAGSTSRCNSIFGKLRKMPGT